MSSPLISCDLLLRLFCLARVRHCLHLLVGVVDWCPSRLVRLIFCRIIFTESSPWRLLFCLSLAICLLVLPPSHSGRVRLDLDPYGGSDSLGMFPLLLKRTADVMATVSVLCFGCSFIWVVSQLAGDRSMSP